MLSTAGASLNYESVRAVDTLPMEIKDALSPVKSASIYQQRVRARAIPTSGTTFGVGASPANGSTSINVVVSSPSDWIDPASATLNFQLALNFTAAAATDTFVLDDLASSVFQRLRIYAGGLCVEDTLYRNVLSLAEVYASTPYQVYKSKLGAEAYAWKFNNEVYGGQKNAPSARALAVGNPTGATGAVSTVYDISLPMSMISSLFRVDKLLPLRNMGSLNIVLDLDPNLIQNCCYKTAGATNVSVVLSSVELRADFITISSLAQALYDEMASSPGGTPIIGYESPTGLVSSYAGSNGSPSQKALVFPRVSPSLSHVVTVRRHAAANAVPAAANGVYLPLSTFEITGYNMANSVNLNTSNFWTVGSTRLPQDPQPVAQSLGMTYDAFNMRQGGFGSIIDAQNFCGAYATTPAVNAGVYDPTCQAQVLAGTFDLYRDGSIFGGKQMGGQQLIQYLTTAESDSAQYNVYAFIFEHRFLRIANNTVMVDNQL